MNIIQRLQGFMTDHYQWTINWTNSSQPAIIGNSSSDLCYYNKSELRGDTIYFFRDISFGRQERFMVSFDGIKVCYRLEINTTAHHYADWELRNEGYATSVQIDV